MNHSKFLLGFLLLSALATAAGGVYYRAAKVEPRLPASTDDFGAAKPAETIEPSPLAVPVAAPEEPIATAEPAPVPEFKPATSLPARTKKISVQPTVVRTPVKTPARAEETETTEATVPAEEVPAPIAAPAAKPAFKQLDLSDEIQAERKTQPVDFQPKTEPEPEPITETPAQATVDVETEVKVTVKDPEPAPEPQPALPMDNPEPALPPSDSEPVAGEKLNDQLTIAGVLGFHGVKTSRASNGQSLSLATKLSPGFHLGHEQNWSEDFQTSAQLEYFRYSFADISGVTSRSLSGSSLSGEIAARWKQTNRIHVGAFAGMKEEFAVNVDSTNVLEPVKYVSPVLGAELKVALLKSEKGRLDLTPRAAYVFQGSHGSEKSKGHLEYSVALGYEKTAEKLFSSTGAEIEFRRSKFDAPQGKTTNTSLGLNLNFNFGI